MSWGAWQDGPAPISDSTTFTKADHAPRFYADPNPLFGGNVAELLWSANWFLARNVNNTYLDGDPRYQQVWDILRGFDANDSDAGLLYGGSAFAPTPTDDWVVQLRREAIEVDLSNTDSYVTMVHHLDPVAFYSIDTLPPGAVDVEIEDGGYGTCTGTVSVSWTAPVDPGDPDYALLNIADIGGLLLAPFNLPVGDSNYPYNALSAMAPPPSDTLAFTGGTYVQPLPDAFLHYSSPPAFLQPLTDWRADDLQFTVDFTITFPRYRFLYADTPPRRQYPRPSHRVYPPPPFASSTRTGPAQIL